MRTPSTAASPVTRGPARRRTSVANGLILVLLFARESTAGPAQPPDPNALAILFVGNSLTYSNDMPEMVRELVEEADIGPVIVTSSSFPNYGLVDHWTDDRTRAAVSPSHDIRTGEVSITLAAAEGAALLDAVRETNAQFRSAEGA